MKKFITLLAITSLFIGCEVDEELNDNPNAFTDAPIGLIINHALLNVAAVSEAAPARIAAMFSDQLTGFDRQYATWNIYSTQTSSYDETWSDGLSAGVAQAQVAKAKAVAAGNAQIQGIAEILEGYYFAETALVFGDIPFSEVNNLDFPDPVYESQATVINGAIALIQSGIAKAGSVTAASNVFSTTSTYGQIGNALVARYNLALGNNSAALAAAKAANFTSTDNDWDIIHSTTNYMENLFWMFEVEERQDYLRVQNSYMSDLINPASSIYSGNAKTDESGRFAWYVDQSNGVSMNTTDGFAAVDRNYPVVSFEEVQLIIAETAVGTNPSEALAALNSVRASNISKYGGNFDAYTTADFAAGGMVSRGLSTSAAMTMEIMIEKFKSVIGGPTYHDIRRNKNLIGTRIKNSETNVIPQRYLYPSSESASNENFPGVTTQYVPVPIFN
jgi:hypothetical protein